MAADALAPKVARASTGMVLTEELLHWESGQLLLSKIQDMIQNMNTSFIIFKTIQIIKC